MEPAFGCSGAGVLILAKAFSEEQTANTARLPRPRNGFNIDIPNLFDCSGDTSGSDTLRKEYHNYKVKSALSTLPFCKASTRDKKRCLAGSDVVRFLSIVGRILSIRCDARCR
jgi:hypothetical protein